MSAEKWDAAFGVESPKPSKREAQREAKERSEIAKRVEGYQEARMGGLVDGLGQALTRLRDASVRLRGGNQNERFAAEVVAGLEIVIANDARRQFGEAAERMLRQRGLP